MLETIGTVMIAAVVVVLLILISLAYQPKGAERHEVVAETIIGIPPVGATAQRLVWKGVL
jgi:hypothetical protein